jgi:hypothetical protein
MRSSQHDRDNRNRHSKNHRSLTRRRRGIRPRLEGLEDRTVLSTMTVMNNHDSGGGSLRAAVAAAKSGDTIDFAKNMNGQTITLTSGELAVTKSLDIEGPGAKKLTISGNHSSRVFDISGGVTLTIAGLTIAHGFVMSDNGGGGILNQDSTLTIAHDDLTDNEALGLGGSNAYVQGGAIDNLAGTTLTVTGCRFIANQVIGGSDGEGVGGGAIGTFANASVTGGTFTSNLAQAGHGGVAPANASFTGDVMGGALVGNSGVVTVDGSTFAGNQAIAGSGGSGGSGVYFIDSAYGGALMDNGGTMTVNHSTIAGNRAQGGNGATGGPDLGFIGDANGGGFAGYGVITFTNSTFDHNEALSGSSNTGSGAGIDASAAYGGAICTDGGGLFGFSDSFTASNVMLTTNRAIGGTGNQAGGDPAGVLVGTATGGGFVLFDGGTSTATINNSTIDHNQAIGGAGEAGGKGAAGRGGGLATHLGGSLVVKNCTVAHNRAGGGEGRVRGNGGNGLGGGIYNDGSTAVGISSLSVTGSSITYNVADGGEEFVGRDDGQGIGGGLYLAAGGIVGIDTTTVVKKNHASTSNENIFGV